MSRWRWALLPALLCSVLLVILRPNGKTALQDSDTAKLLEVIRSNPDPDSGRPQSIWNWFTGDWPLHNHFYRPISTLSFEMDSRLHGDDGGGYVLTNALIASLCLFALVWLLRELTDKPFLAGFGGFVFGFWNLGWSLPWWFAFAWVPVLVLGFFRQGLRLLPALLAAGAVSFLADELMAHSLNGAVVGWIPGRTASLMTLFCLISMAAFARHVRTTATMRPKPETTPLDPPNTRNTVPERGRPARSAAWEAGETPALRHGWIILAFLSAALALGSHEQAIMLPGAMVGVAVSMSLQRYRVKWAWVGGFFLLLGGYFLLRHALLPSGISSYQAQQLRSGNAGAIGALMEYFMPGLRDNWEKIIGGFDPALGLDFWKSVIPYAALCGIFAIFAAGIEARRRWIPALTGWALSIIAFLPMAWIKPFPHYDYWPLALRSLFVAALAAAAWESALTAWSPRAIRLPLRRAPAPGSLPRP